MVDASSSTATRSTSGCRDTVVGAPGRGASGEGRFPRDLDVECLADTLLAALNIDLYLYQRHQLGMERERIVGGLRSLLDGLRVSRVGPRRVKAGAFRPVGPII